MRLILALLFFGASTAAMAQVQRFDCSQTKDPTACE